MRLEIKCEICSEIMGTIDKPEITQTDLDEFRTMFTCSNGHAWAPTSSDVSGE